MEHYTKQTAIHMLQERGGVYSSSFGEKLIHGSEFCFRTGISGSAEKNTGSSYYGLVVVNKNAAFGSYGLLEQNREMVAQ